MYNQKEILTQKREKFRVTIRQLENEKIFSLKRYATLFPLIQMEIPSLELEQSDVQSLQQKILETIQTQNYESYNLSQKLEHFFKKNNIQDFTEAYSLGLHLNLYSLIKKFPISANFQVNALKVLANIIYYIDITFFQDDPDIITLLVMSICQNEYPLVSQASICVLGNLLSQIDANNLKYYILKNQLFFQFWTEYLEQEQNLQTIRNRVSRIPWILVSLVPNIYQNEEYLGPLSLIKQIISKIKFKNIVEEMAKDIIKSLKQIFRSSPPSFIEELTKEVMYKEIVQLVEVSQGKYEQFNLEVNIKAAKVLLIICHSLERDSRIDFYYYGLKETIIYLFSNHEPQSLCIALEFLGLFFQTTSQFVDSIFYEFYQDNQLTSQLISLASGNQDVKTQSEALRVIDLAVSYGSAFINQKFILDGLFHHTIPLLQNSTFDIQQKILQIVDTIQQREEYNMDDKLKWLNSALESQNFINQVDYLMDTIYDEELIMLCTRVLNNMQQ